MRAGRLAARAGWLRRRGPSGARVRLLRYAAQRRLDSYMGKLTKTFSP